MGISGALMKGLGRAAKKQFQQGLYELALKGYELGFSDGREGREKNPAPLKEWIGLGIDEGVKKVAAGDFSQGEKP